MKTKLNLLFIFLFIIPIVSCNKNFVLPADFLGIWECGKTDVIVRTKIKGEGYQFHEGIADSITFELYENNTASGKFGLASFDNATVIKNGGNPLVTGCTYVIECGKIGKIFPDDPLDNKEVEIWLGIIEGGQIDAELRYTEGMAHFPMAGMVFERK